ncbi:spore cortex-lytic enzyme [Psychrobacillus sp. AK 1817]|uniref:Spore cortex-lytic enzyme n=2 Tax=Bacillaceae TaxID=186817 RepID=A0ABR8RCB9_9BACI|nr:spore cortex-lytic enzyme [Psychrobacillus faecigallinarum]QEY19876.1 spore cortex-lytic enzyme [Psychrobacillus sp. AK 1817]QGM30416.1 spore cortex-lytic enzyme [Bacillus sp. N3536]
MKQIKYILIGLIFCTASYMLLTKEQTTQAFSEQIVQRGAYGDDVIELQARLQYIGYYTGEIDGKFGYGTYWALRNFQEKYGLPVDGMLGESTKSKLVKASKFDKAYVHEQINKGKSFTYYGNESLDNQVKNEKPDSTNMQLPPEYSERDLKLIANAVYGEARGEPYEGQVAVAAVILNRIEHPDFPNTVSEVIFQPLAFTAVADGQIWLEPNERAKEAVLDALNGWDPSENAIYYFNPDTATSQWIWSRPHIKKIGQHIFCS